MKGVSFDSTRKKKGDLFGAKWHIKGQRVGSRGGASTYKNLLSTSWAFCFGTSAQIRLQLGNKNILFKCQCVAYNGNNLLPGRLNKPPDFNTEKSSTSVLYSDRRRVSLGRGYFTAAKCHRNLVPILFTIGPINTKLQNFVMAVSFF